MLWRGKLYKTEDGMEFRSRGDVRGVFTVQYPEERLATPEEFRFIPFLIYEEGPNGEQNQRCTSCEICAKVCPPQCIWIYPLPIEYGQACHSPREFYIDTDICMNCGFCAEYCPFDAIKMDHDFEIVSYDRKEDNIYDIEKLSRPASYYVKSGLPILTVKKRPGPKKRLSRLQRSRLQVQRLRRDKDV